MTAAHTPGTLRVVVMPGNTFPTIYGDVYDIAEMKFAGGADHANARRLALCWNALAGLDNDAVERLGAYLEGLNSDQVRDFIADGDA